MSTPTLIVRGDRLFVAARINGVETSDALLDSGAEMSFLDKSFAEQVGLVTAGSETARGTGGEEEVTFAEGVTIEAAGLTLENQTVAVLDLSDISSRVVGYPVSIVVGREIFDAARLKIDIEASSIEVIARDADPVGVMLPMETHKGLQTIPASVEGGEPVQADFDLGNGNDVLIGADYAERVGLSAPERIVGQKAGGGIGGEVMRDMIVLRELEIAGVTFHDVPAAIDRTDTAADLNVGVRILRKFVITTDFSQSAVWLQER
ncbi:MAG TPA: pepsin/retropepsin-like aspartic protease family protein [Parvularculaceae bacterium]|nr:aspartyl protease family protein [Caulobacterales bacterium]HOP18575.1 pepsin/retropepsin-like aspartic protease family protein [Amphiplicatus sp.]HPE29947.1 pepsin/retropepsin-like aspartic protease family protein [Parvularculaceae bacterium]HRX38802.1 pepsin/retropepsin-like aspartic protease family protein [Parvularculaceae bacterium]